MIPSLPQTLALDTAVLGTKPPIFVPLSRTLSYPNLTTAEMGVCCKQDFGLLLFTPGVLSVTMLPHIAKQIMIPEQLTSKQGCFPELSSTGALTNRGGRQFRLEEKARGGSPLPFQKMEEEDSGCDLKKLGIALC